MPMSASCLRHRIVFLAALAGLFCAGEAQAQRIERMRPWETARPWAAISIVDIGSATPNERPRHALRLRFDSATHAMRSLGIDAQDCSSLLRSTTRMRAEEPGATERLEVSVSFALSCRFF